jgi:sugar lactone lactonase YvrE
VPRFVAALFASLVVASAASATPEARITARLQSPTEAVTAGRGWTAIVLVRDGKRPYSGRVSILARGDLGRRTYAARRAKPGRYRARIVFPGGGLWTLQVRAGRRTARLASIDVRGAGPRISGPHGVEIAEEHGDLLVADREGTGFFEVNLRTRAKKLVASGFDHPMFLNFGPGGFLYVVDAERVWRFEPDGSKTPIAGNGTRGLSGDGGPATAAQLGGPGDFAFDAAGNLYISEYDNGVRIVTPDGRIATLAGVGREGYSGDGGPARAAEFGAPHALDVLPDGTVFVADSHNGVIRRIDGASRVVTTVADGFSAPVGIDARADGSFYVADARLDHIVRVAPNGARTAHGRRLDVPVTVAADSRGNLYVSELERRTVRRIDAVTGRMSVIVRP